MFSSLFNSLKALLWDLLSMMLILQFCKQCLSLSRSISLEVLKTWVAFSLLFPAEITGLKAFCISFSVWSYRLPLFYVSCSVQLHRLYFHFYYCTHSPNNLVTYLNTLHILFWIHLFHECSFIQQNFMMPFLCAKH